MGSLSETAKKCLAFIPVAIAGVYIGRSAARLYNLQIEQHAMAMEAIKRFTQEIQKWEMERKSNSANIVCRDVAGPKDEIWSMQAKIIQQNKILCMRKKDSQAYWCISCLSLLNFLRCLLHFTIVIAVEFSSVSNTKLVKYGGFIVGSLIVMKLPMHCLSALRLQ